MRKRSVAWSVAFLGVALFACAVPFTIIPSAHIEVVVQETSNEAAIVDRLHSAFVTAGYKYRVATRERPSFRVYRWYVVEPKPGRHPHSIEVRYPKNSSPRTVLTVVYLKGYARPFTEDEWREFFRIRDAEMPRLFPGASIRTARHPAEFTETQDLRRFKELFEEELPAADSERLRIYESDWKRRFGL